MRDSGLKVEVAIEPPLPIHSLVEARALLSALRFIQEVLGLQPHDCIPIPQIVGGGTLIGFDVDAGARRQGDDS
jgi:hypothetical protein